MGQAHSWRDVPAKARVFIALVTSVGACLLFFVLSRPISKNIPEFICYLLLAVLAARLKVKLPGITGTMSVNFLFVLLGIVELNFPETLVLGSAAIVAQCFYPNRPSPIQISFNTCASAISIAVAFGVYHLAYLNDLLASRSLLLGISAAAYFIVNTALIATVISLTEKKSLGKLWLECYFWSFPYYLIGAAIAGTIGWYSSVFNWETSLLIVPVIYLIYRSYLLYLSKLEDEKRQVEEMAHLHLRTIEALALAIEAKDHTTHEHLHRVRVYATEVAKELKLPQDEMEALQAAALLHDIGKLAIPEHIVSKPGKLTVEEFEKMKIHPLVGAEILERVRFPYPVVPIVRAHHEKWNGTGYPFGLKGIEIPLGARILSAVDFVDAMSSHRQYRRALPLTEAVARLVEESGKSFDPQVVAILQSRYRQMQEIVDLQSDSESASTITPEANLNGEVEDLNRIESDKDAPATESNFLISIAAARQEAQTLFELSQDLGASLSLGETLSVFSMKLRRSVPYDGIAVYVLRQEELVPEYVNGDNFRLFGSLRIPFGQGLSGWVAQHRKPIINGNPSVEPGYLNDATKFSTLESALVVPLEGLKGVIGVMALYHQERNAFTSDHLRILQAISSKMALAIDNALKYQQAENSATTDFLTGLPNARSLFLLLDRELARCKRDNSPLLVMVCDMDGFKQINDRFGHLEGNRVLRLFAQALKDTCREYDYVARLGGDEFVVVAPGLPNEAAGKKAIQLRELAQQAGREICGEDILSLSVGQAQYPEDGRDAEKLLAEADRRMYLEKQNSRSAGPTGPVQV